jgi:hypothetical protein
MKHRDKFESQNVTKLKMIKEVKNKHAVYVCPKCGGDVFREEEELGDYHPDHEHIYYETWDTCENNPTECDFAERYIPDNNF